MEILYGNKRKAAIVLFITLTLSAIVACSIQINASKVKETNIKLEKKIEFNKKKVSRE